MSDRAAVQHLIASVSRKCPPSVWDTEMPITEIINLIQIDDTLATSGQPTEEELAAVAEAQFEVVINLALHDDPRYSLPDEAGTVTRLGMTYVHIPVIFTAPNASDLSTFFEALDAHRGKKLLIHCAANKRVTAFLGLYRVIKQNWAADAAFMPMRQVWEPNEVWAAFIAEMLARRP
jgi:protein tyrosine phosphatase (PTP) superfamily phosphohydrolase (DUF442 family)